MDKLLTAKSLTTSRAFTYQYYTDSNETSSSNPALLLLHGFPMDSSLWEDVVPLLQKAFPTTHLIVIDMLGHGGSSKPTDTTAYAVDGAVADLVELLAAEHVQDVVPIGHDFGAWLAQRFYLFHPARCPCLVLLSVAYMPPILADVPFSLDFFLAVTEEQAGYPRYEYFRFFIAEDAPAVMDAHLQSLYHLITGDHPTSIKDYYCAPGAFREYLEEDMMDPVKEWARKPGRKEAFVARLGKDSIAAPLTMYRSMTEGIQDRIEKAKFAPEDLVIRKPVLFVGCLQDAVARADGNDEPEKMGLLPDLTKHVLDCSHYCPLEKPDEVAGFIIEFLKQRGIVRE